MTGVNQDKRIPMRRFGEKLRMLRKQRGLTLMELAEALGYTTHSNSYISLIENGKRVVRTEFILKVADFFGVSMDELTRDELELQPPP